MTLLRFAKALRSGEVLQVEALSPRGPQPLAAEDLAQVRDLLVEWEAERRWDLPAPLPALSITSARWAMQLFYRVTQAWVTPSLAGEQLQALLSVPAPELPTRQSAYSVDLVFRFLPELLARGEGMASALWSQQVRELLRPWPLSAVGSGVESPTASYGFLDEPGLLKLYVDRLLRANEVGVADPRVLVRRGEVSGGRRNGERLAPLGGLSESRSG